MIRLQAKCAIGQTARLHLRSAPAPARCSRLVLAKRGALAFDPSAADPGLLRRDGGVLRRARRPVC